MESFFSSLKTKRIARKTCCTRNQARADVFNYIKLFYNHAAQKGRSNLASKTYSDAPPPRDQGIVATLDTWLRWLSSWTIHNANHLRDSFDGLKVGGHQSSCASIATIMAVLYFHALRLADKVAVKPHAGPVLHAIHYLLGNQSREQLERSRGFGGAQSYPSRTKDQIPVDFATGSVGLYDRCEQLRRSFRTAQRVADASRREGL